MPHCKCPCKCVCHEAPGGLPFKLAEAPASAPLHQDLAKSAAVQLHGDSGPMPMHGCLWHAICRQLSPAALTMLRSCDQWLLSHEFDAERRATRVDLQETVFHHVKMWSSTAFRANTNTHLHVRVAFVLLLWVRLPMCQRKYSSCKSII